MIFVLRLFLAVVFGSCFLGAKKLLTSGAWELHKQQEQKRSVLFMLSNPIKQTGTYKKRSKPFISITCWLELGIHGDVGIFIGYPINTKKKVEVTVIKAGGTGWKKKFMMTPIDETAWFADSEKESRFTAAVRDGDTLEVKAYSQKGNYSLDTYSLKGSAVAYRRLTENLLKHQK